MLKNPVPERRFVAHVEDVTEHISSELPSYVVASPPRPPYVYRDAIPPGPWVIYVGITLSPGELCLYPRYYRLHVWPPVVMRCS